MTKKQINNIDAAVARIAELEEALRERTQSNHKWAEKYGGRNVS